MLSGDPGAVRAIDGSFALVASGGHHGADGALDGSPAAVLPGQAAGGSGAVRRRSHRHAASGARRRRPRRAVSSQLHPHGAGPLRRRSGARRVSRIRIRSTRGSSRRSASRCPAISTRSAAGTSARWPTRSTKWLTRIDDGDSHAAPIGVAFSGGVDSGSVFLVTYHTMLRLGMSPTRLKAFVLNIVDGAGRESGGRRPRRRAGARLSLEPRPVAVSRGDRRHA